MSNESVQAKAQESAQHLEQIQRETVSVSKDAYTQKLKEANDNYDPMLAPAGLFGLYYPLFMNGINQLNGKSLKRVINALMAYPLEEIYPYKNNELEKQVYQIGLKLMDAKYIMMLTTAYEAEQKRAEMQAKNLAEQSVNQNTETKPVEELKKEEPNA